MASFIFIENNGTLRSLKKTDPGPGHWLWLVSVGRSKELHLLFLL